MSVVIPNEVRIWKVTGKPGPVRAQNHYPGAGTSYSLFCEDGDRYLSYAKQTFGINLEFIPFPDGKVHLHLPDHQERPIRTGEVFALGIGGGDAFLRYAERDVGINLKWSSEPVYEWRFLGANPQAGEAVPADSPMALVNVAVKPGPDFLIRFPRVGADIGWTTTPGWLSRLAPLVVEAVGSAKVVLAAF